MAEVTELIIKYRADVSELQGKIDQIEAALKRAENAGKGIGAGLGAQVGIVENLRNRLTQLTKARDQANDPAKILRLNDLIKVQGTRLDELTGKARRVATETARFGSGIASLNVQPLSQQFTGLLGTIGAAFAIERVFAFGKAAEKAFQEAEESALKLRTAVSVSGGLQQDFDTLIKQSEELQKVTIFSDEAIKDAQTAALQFGLTSNEVEKLIPIVADFAAATGQDLKTALDAVLRGIEGQNRGLKLYGVSLKEGGTRAENLSQITGQLNSKFLDQAKLIGETSVGAAKRYENALNDLQEEIGAQLAPKLQGLRSLFLDLAKAGTDAATDIGKAFDFIFRIQEQKAKGSDSFQELRTAADEAKKKFQELNLSQQQAEDKLDNVISRRKELLTNITSQSGIQLALSEEQLNTYTAEEIALRQIIAEIDKQPQGKKKVFDITTATTAELERQLEILETKTDLTSRDLADAIKKELEARKKANDELIKQKQEASKRLVDIEKKLNDELLLSRGQTDVEKLRTQQAILAQEIESTFNASQQTIADERNRNSALVSLRETFGTRIREAQEKIDADLAKQRVDALASEQESIRKTFESLTDEVALASVRAQADLKEQFLNQGDFSPEAFEKLNQELLNIETETNNKRSEEARKFANEFVAQQNRIISAVENNKRLAEEKIVFEFVAAGDFSPAAFIAMNARRAKLQVEANAETKKLTQEAEDVQRDADNQITENFLANLDLRLAGMEKEQELLEKQKELLKELRDAAIQAALDIISNSIDARADADIRATQDALDVELAAIDESIEANEEKRRRGIIGDRAAAAEKERLEQKRVEAERRAASQERRIKREQFAANQLAAVAEITIAALVASAEAGFNPILTALYAGLAALQIAVVYSQPNPYKKGSKSTKSGLSLVGEEGPELMFMPKGNKILPADKTRRHADVIDAMYDGKLDEYIQQYYIAPELKKQAAQAEGAFNFSDLNAMLAKLQISPQLKAAEAQFKIMKNEQFAMNIANSIFLNKEALGMTGAEFSQRADEIRRKGTYYRNAHEITAPIVEALKSKDKSRLRR